MTNINVFQKCKCMSLLINLIHPCLIKVLMIFFCLVMRKGIVLFVFANTTNELVSKTVNDANK